MTINHMGRMMRVKSLAMVIAGTLGLSIAAIPSAQGQAVPRQLPPDPPPELPSVSDYSLPPGEGQNPADGQAEGPTEENGPAPQAAPPSGSALPGTQPAAQPAPISPVDAPTIGGQTRPTPTGPALSGSPRTSAPVTNPPTATPTRRPAGDPAVAAPSVNRPAIDSDQPQPGFSTELPRQTMPSNPSAPKTVSEASPEISSGGTILHYAVGGIVLLLLSGLGAYFWRRKTVMPSQEEEITDDPELLTATDSIPASKPHKPAPKIYSPPNPSEPEKPNPLSSNGFVTSKIGAVPKPLPTAAKGPPIAPKPDRKPGATDYLQIDLAANSASSTLLNAVLNYTITLTNQSDQSLHDIHLSGTMMQADSENARNGDIETGEPLHKIENLAVGETISLTGDIRLPLNAIRPITFKSQALFIPLARFGVVYADQSNVEYRQAASFIIGREYEPRRPKMAPFRLDLGPRNFSPVGQRPLNI
ncbi:hypothetical protein [Parasphingorhabdus cellanae]|uniref:DUF11 domain-containing protein n=1 Tax=Parasphingorhabdus cellanae TaxID=2806553 RepID=A0ABX7T3I2_9SPHN|nr:hypothetical protein [Parasphingorhabdus cellanae]QTD55357.1 hypothetical protein J4G78_14235 [Parasphingorhabdus cellanae]